MLQHDTRSVTSTHGVETKRVVRSRSDKFKINKRSCPSGESRKRAQSWDTIDKMLRDTERRNRKQKLIKVLLLGQSESGACPSPLFFDVFVPLVPRFSSLDEIPLVFLSVYPFFVPCDLSSNPAAFPPTVVSRSPSTVPRLSIPS